MGGGSFFPLHDTMYDQFGRKIDIKALRIATHLEEMKAKHHGNPWPVIEECLNVWKDQHPTTWKSYLHRLDDIRDTRRDKKFGTSRTGMFRYTLDIPQNVMYMIRALYSDEELPMDKQFFKSFAQRFSKFTIAEAR